MGTEINPSSFGIPAALDDYHVEEVVDCGHVEKDESGVRRIYAREYEAGEAHGRWVRSQQVATKLRVLAVEREGALKTLLQDLACEIEMGE